ncbi:hypothetical protein [Streptomyces sp. NRRL WC-3742]|uniref:hypothetical protein n=1 Tax=Streptomyces sp. NRRL WC-3742 TaxID=1463934 RepID=UPI0004C91B5E|nr:hypothetical protein [Streptomyces sp. NRRL WC-3742]
MVAVISSASPSGAGLRFDPVLADRVIEAVLLAGLPVAFGGHGPGVQLRPAEPLDDRDRCAGLIALHWEPSARLASAAAMEQPQQPAFRARQVVSASMVNALGEFLPALGITVERSKPGWETRVHGTSGPGPAANSRALPRSSPGRIPPGLEFSPGLVTSLRRSAALAALPVAALPGEPGITLGPCSSADLEDSLEGGLEHGLEDDRITVASVGWNPSRRLSALADSDTPTAASAVKSRTAVRNAMLHALGAVLGACGTSALWHRRRQPYQLRVTGASGQPPIRY